MIVKLLSYALFAFFRSTTMNMVYDEKLGFFFTTAFTASAHCSDNF